MPSATKKIGLLSLILYTVALDFGIRWAATGATAGLASLWIWVAAGLLFLAPLSVATLELSSRYPDDGAIYVWVREALGPLSGFVCGFVYWVCNLPFFAGLLLFIIALMDKATGGAYKPLLTNPVGIFAIASALIVLVAALHAKGIGTGQWLSSIGALLSVSLLGLLIFGALTVPAPQTFSLSDLSVPLSGDSAILWSTLVFAYGGAEAVAFLRNDVEGGVKSVAIALIGVGVGLCLAYVAGSFAIMSVLGPDVASRLGGLPDALSLILEKLGLSAFSPALMFILGLALLGQLSAWFGAAAKLPYAAGLSDTMPKALGRLDPKTGAPTTAIWTQSLVVIALLALSLSGKTLSAAYDFIVAMSVISYTLPFALLFIVYLKVQKNPVPLDWQNPWKTKGAYVIGTVGLLAALSAILGSLVPSSTDPTPLNTFINLAIATATLIGIGVLLYFMGTRRAKP